jgi:hypothetical protein
VTLGTKPAEKCTWHDSSSGSHANWQERGLISGEFTNGILGANGGPFKDGVGHIPAFSKALDSIIAVLFRHLGFN